MNSNGDAPAGTVNHEPTPQVASSPRPRKRSSSAASSPRAPPPANGTRSPPRDDAANESEAETVVLEGTSGEQSSPKAPRAIKREYSDDGIDALPLQQSNKAANSLDSRKNSQTSGVDNQELAENGAKRGMDRDEKSPVPASPSGRTPRQTKETSPALSPPPSTARPRSASTTESRKRKHREESISKPFFEPPRQKAKTEGLRESRTHPTSPATPGLGLGRPHKRSQSIQSVVHSIPGRKRRDVTALHIPTERRDWSESSSERSSSPRPHSAIGMRTKRSSHRSIASPARTTMAHKKDKFGATRLARESEKGELDNVKSAYDAAPEDLDEPDYAGITPLQKAALQGHDDIVEYLISKGCRTDCKSQDLDTPLIDAVENSHLAVVRLLLQEGHVNPHHKNNKGQRAIDVVDNAQPEAEEIRRLLREAMNERMDDPMDDEESASAPERLSTRLRNNEYNTETLIERAGDGDKAAVNELISNGVKANIACGVAASRGGHYDILSVLLATGLKADLDPAKHTDTPLVVAIGKGHLNIVKMLLGLEGFNPTRRNRDGKTYYQISEERKGPHWQEEYEILKHAYEQYQRTHWSPKRSRKDGPKTSVPRKRKPSRERSTSPAYEPKRANLGKSTGSHPPQKPRRLLSGKEVAARRSQRRVSSDESSDDESEDDVRPPGKRRAYSDGDEDIKPVKKITQSRSESHHGGKRPHSDDSEHEDPPKHRSKIRTRVEKIHRSKPTPTPDAESDHEARPLSKLAKTRVVSGDRLKKRRPSDVSTDDKLRFAHAKPSPAPPDKVESPNLTRERRQEADRLASEAKRKVADQQEAIRRAADEEATRKKAAAEAEAKRAQEAAEATRRQEEEAQARKRAAEEAEETKRQEKLSARRERISKLPRALRRACGLGKSRPLHFSGDELGISTVFLPLFFAAPQDLQIGAGGSPRLESHAYVPSFQAVGILGLPELDLAHMDQPYSAWARIPMSRTQRELFLRQYDVALLAQDSRFPMEGMPNFNFEETQDRIREARQQFLDMEGLYWIPADTLSEEVEKRDDLKPLLQDITDEAKRRRVALVDQQSHMSGSSTPKDKKVWPRKSFLDVVLERSKSVGNASEGKEKEKAKTEEGEGKENAVDRQSVKVNGNG